jgi:hypothetical protein
MVFLGQNIGARPPRPFGRPSICMPRGERSLGEFVAHVFAKAESSERFRQPV